MEVFSEVEFTSEEFSEMQRVAKVFENDGWKIYDTFSNTQKINGSVSLISKKYIFIRNI